MLSRTARLSQAVKAVVGASVRFQSSPAPHAKASTQTHTETPAAAAKTQAKPSSLPDEEVVSMVHSGKLRFFNLENDLDDFERAVKVRRKVVEQKTGREIKRLAYENYDYAAIHGQCCENVIGMVNIPVGVAGPLKVDGKEYYVPLATTEGALVASTARGCRALTMSGGVHTELMQDGMSRAPVLSVPSAAVGAEIKRFIEDNFDLFAKQIAGTSRFARLKEIKCFLAGRKLFIRFKCSTGDAMGMNMVGKGVDQALSVITQKFEDVHVLALSGNVCTDKKPSAINWIDGRGKSVVAEAIIKGDVVEKILKTSVEGLVEVNYAKNLIGSAVAGSIGGFNAHASNIVTALYLATGQDPAQNVESSNCMTLIEPCNDGKDIYMSVTMPSIEVGTVGGGTSLPGQNSMLELLGVRGSNAEKPGANAQTLARIVASTVMAGELSLLSALSSGHLISSHLKLNRKPHNPLPPAPTPALH